MEIQFSTSEDVPNTIEGGVVYLVGDKIRPWLALMKCPCGCGDQIMLNLLGDAKPCWNVLWAQSYIPTGLSPSIHRLDGCKSHFFVRNFKIDWA